MIEFITANWDFILMCALALVGLGAIIARFTPTPVDNTIFAYLYDLIASITPNDRKEKVEAALEQVEDIVDNAEDVIGSVQDSIDEIKGESETETEAEAEKTETK